MALSAASLHEGEQGAHATAATHEEGRHMASQTQVSDRRPCNLSWPTLLKDRRALVARLILRCPVVVYRLGFGWLLGHQFLLLTHVGRRTGRVRETVLKVLHYDPTTGESVVASAWGEQTDWYRNLWAHPALAVRTANEWYVPQQRVLPSDEAFAVFETWTRRQRWFARLMLAQVGASLDRSAAERRALADRFPFIGFRPEFSK
jgi:deazaflavin-dependent oxidoreductase (nitroreductase family)